MLCFPKMETCIFSNHTTPVSCSNASIQHQSISVNVDVKTIKTFTHCPSPLFLSVVLNRAVRRNISFVNKFVSWIEKPSSIRNGCCMLQSPRHLSFLIPETGKLLVSIHQHNVAQNSSSAQYHQKHYQDGQNSVGVNYEIYCQTLFSFYSLSRIMLALYSLA